MSDLFNRLKSKVDGNARRAVDVYTSELPEYGSAAFSGPRRDALMDLAVLLRRRTAELAVEDRYMSDEDLEFVSAMGRQRGEWGVSLTAHRSVVVLHSTLMLREVQEAAGPKDGDNLMHMLGWLARQGTVAGRAFTQGFLDGQRRILPAVARVQMLTDLLLTDDSAAPDLARGLAMQLPGRYVVTVVRVAGEPDGAYGATREEITEILVRDHHVPMTWHRPEEFVALVPCGNADPVGPADLTDPADSVRERVVSLTRDFAEMVARPCAVGTATGAVSELAAAVALARQVSVAAPIEAVPSRAYTVADVFVELGTAGIPPVDRWLRDVAGRLAGGPALVTTLDAYYRSDMNRLLTAGSLHIHPRTLDYRLGRVHELTGIKPGSTHGVRVLSTTVARLLAGAWSDLF